MNFAAFPALLAIAVTTPAQNSHAPKALQKIADLRDKYRPLLIFEPGKDHRLHEQIRILTELRQDLIDRNVMLVPFAHAWAGTVDRSLMIFPSQEESALRKRFGVHAPDFTVILLGKDGGEKFRSHTLVTREQLKQVIDAMPMRQQEMRSHPSP